MNRYEKKWYRSQKRASLMEGKGLFVYKNNTSGELLLPKKTKSGQTRVAFKEEFQGDDYYMSMVRDNQLIHVRTIEDPNLNENTEFNMNEKLITEQPPIVTNEGTVEFITKKNKKLNESKPAPQPEIDILLNENPLEGVELF